VEVDFGQVYATVAAVMSTTEKSKSAMVKSPRSSLKLRRSAKLPPAALEARLANLPRNRPTANIFQILQDGGLKLGYTTSSTSLICVRKIAVWLANAAGRIARLSGRWGGTTLPGKVALKLWPSATSSLAKRLGKGSIVLSATNGKTTTARLLSHCAEAEGATVCANSAGANLVSGITAALLPLASSKVKCDYGIFEVDEAALPEVAERIAPQLVLLMNLFRDQLDRHGELELIAKRWHELAAKLSPSTKLLVNADDPALVALAEGREGTEYFGISDPSVNRGKLPHAADVTRCRHCRADLSYDIHTVGHLGRWRCANCSWQRPELHYEAKEIDTSPAQPSATAISLTTPDGTLKLAASLPGLHNAYNTIAASAAACCLGFSGESIAKAVSETEAVFGRSETLDLANRKLIILLAKNPTGANENIRTVQEAAFQQAAIQQTSASLPTLLIVLNDRVADGHDVSWIWDVDYESLLQCSSRIICSGDRAHELGLRFRYSSMNASTEADNAETGSTESRIEPDLAKTSPAIEVIPSLSTALDRAVSATPEGGTIFALPTYTATLELRAELTSRGAASPFWKSHK